MEDVDLPARLKSGTKDLHARAERTGVMGDLIARRITRTAYLDMLRNLHRIYEALEEGLDRHTGHDGLAGLWWPALRRAPALAADLEALSGAGAGAGALVPATEDYARRLRELAASDPARLAAHAYVRYLGDLHGGQVLRSLVREQFGLTGDEGTRFYEFGSREEVVAARERLREALRRLDPSAATVDELVGEARWAFEAHCRLFEEIAAAAQAAVDTQAVSTGD